MKNILIMSEAFPPETKSASTLFFELAESLVKRDYGVTVLTRMPRYNVADGTNLQEVALKEKMSGIDVVRFKTPPLARHIPFIRGLEHFLIGWQAFWHGTRLGNFDIILVYSPPLPLGIAGYWAGKILKCPVVVNIQDLYPQTVIDLGLLENPILIQASKMMERFIYRRSDYITVHSEGNLKYVVEHGASQNSSAVVHNWVDCDLIQPGARDNDFARKYDLSGKFVVSFAGVMGFAQGLEVVIKSAEILKDQKDIFFVLVGDGLKKAELIGQAERLGLKQVKFIPTQPRHIYPQVLHASDICLVTLGKDLVTPVVPGKMLSIMAAGKPVLACLPLVGDAKKIIELYQCGLVVEAGEASALAKAILKLYNNKTERAAMGQNGRSAAVKVFSRESCVEQYAQLFNQLRIRSK